MSREISIYDYDRISDQSRSELIKRTEADLSEFISGVRPIIEAVKREGDQALIRYARDLDKADISRYGVKVEAGEFDKAFEALDPDLIHTIEFAAASIKRFHQGQRPEALRFVKQFPGVFAGDRFNPIPSVACYVPRGKGAFPSVVMMSTIPAVVAGVPKAYILTPPGPDGQVDAATLVAARVSGIEAVYRCGGAQAVAAAAYGTDSVPRADKIVGPGSPWVVAAKRVLADIIDPGTPAGPSESITLGNFVLGPNAILPTSRAARIHSPLSVFDFMKMTSIGYVTAEAYPELAHHAHRLAVYEGFDGHALAVSKLRGEFLNSK